MQRKSEIKKEPINILKPIIEALGYKLEKKQSHKEMVKPGNLDELKKMTEEELKTKMLSISEEIEMQNKKMSTIKNNLLDYFKKEGPTEFTRTLFSGTAIPTNRVNIISGKLRDLQLQKEYIEILMKDRRKQRIISIFSDEEIKSIEVGQGPVGTVMQVIID